MAADVMGSPEPDEQGTDVFGGDDPIEKDETMGRPDPISSRSGNDSGAPGILVSPSVGVGQ